MKVLTTIKSLSELDIDLIDSNEAMLVLNNLPNVQILNGRSTKDEDDEEEENIEGEGEYGESNEVEEEYENQMNMVHKENMNININSINNKNSHLYPQMEEIEEDKNLENNYISETNNNENNNNNNDNKNDTKSDDNNNAKNFNSYEGNQKEISSLSNKEKKMTRNINKLNEEDLNPKIDSIDQLYQPNSLLYDKIISDNSNKKVILNCNEKNKNLKIDNNNYNNNDNENDNNTQKIEKEKESLYDLDESKNENEKSGNFNIDITNEELNSLKEGKYGKNSEFFGLMNEFCNLLNSDEDNTDGIRIQNNYLEKINKIERDKPNITNYYYFYMQFKKKIKIIQNMYSEILPYIIDKCPELNKDNILLRLNNELFNTIKDSKDFVGLLHSHIETYNEKRDIDKQSNKSEEKENNINENKVNEIKVNENKTEENKINEKINENLNQIIKEKDNKINSLEQMKDNLIHSMEEDKLTYEKKISTLEKENKIMTEKILSKANSMINSTIAETQGSFPPTDRCMSKPNTNKNKKFMFNNDLLNTNFINHYIPTSNSRSPVKLTENTNTIDVNNTTNYLNTHTNVNVNINTSKQQIISLKTLKDFINELYTSKAQYDSKCIEYKLPKETLEEHMYTFLNKKYGLKNLIIEWAKNIIGGIKYYSKKDSVVLLFGKIMRNEQEEDARFIIKKVMENIEGLLLYYIKRQNPLKLVNEIQKLFEQKKKSELFEEEWKGIIYSIYEKDEADEIEKKIESFIGKENEKKKMEMFKKYKISRINKQNKKNYSNNYTNANNSYYLNTINSLNVSNNYNLNSSYMNSIGNINNNNKLSRQEKYNMLLFPDEKKILYKDFIKIVLDNHIRFRDKQLKNFLELFKSVDSNKDGIINEEEFTELVQKMKLFKEEETEDKIYKFLEKIDPFDNQKFTFSECVNFFSSELITEKDINGNEKEISILEKICFPNNKKNGNNEIKNNEINNKGMNNNAANNNENNKEENKHIIESSIDSNNNLNI